MKSFTEKLVDWTDLDYAMHELALSLGLVKAEDGSFARDIKWVYWTTNRYYEALMSTLFKMVDIGLFECDEEMQKIRTNVNFRLEH